MYVSSLMLFFQTLKGLKVQVTPLESKELIGKLMLEIIGR